MLKSLNRLKWPGLNATGEVSRSEVLWCYRNLLGREPESKQAVQSHLMVSSFKQLVENFVLSPEFRARVGAAALSRTTLDTDTPKDKSAGWISPKDNHALAMAEFNAGVLEVRSTPRTLTLETSSACNLRCVMCAHSINGVARPKHLEGQLIAALERFIRQSRSIQLHGIGEPLVSPAFWASLKYIPAGCDASINTNFTVLDERRLKDLVNSRIKVVNVSLDAARPETYQKIRGHSLASVTDNIRRFVKARRDAGKKFPHLYMNMTLMRSNIEEVLEFIDLAVELGADNLCFWHLNRWPQAEMRRYVIEREGWVFDYEKEGLWNFPALSNRWLRRAEAYAKEKGILLRLSDNKLMYFDE